MSEVIVTWNSLADESAALAALEACRLETAAVDGLYAYALLLQEFNEHTNLVANANLDVLLKDHILDSLRLLPYLAQCKRHSPRLIDIGSGAGFPGMVLAIAQPSLKVTLVESIGKKCRFLEDAAFKLGLADRVRVICERAETLGHDRKYRERFDFATARAVAALPVVAELCLPFLQVGGVLLAQRSKRQVLTEQDEADAYASRLGGCVSEIVNFELDLLGRELSLILIEKRKTTARTYPRTAAQMKRDL